jgi:signal transduction histidine kinase/CheY-like chemotaxis protein
MMRPIIDFTIVTEEDVVLVRRRARLLAALIGFDTQDQVRIATAVSEIARNAFRYAVGGKANFALEGERPPQTLVVKIADRGPGIPHLNAVLEGRYQSRTGMGMGIVGARRLMDGFEIASERDSGTSVMLKKRLPRRAKLLTPAEIEEIGQELARTRRQEPLEELQRQNQELLRLMDEIRSRQEDLERMNGELEATNRGVLALYAELDERADRLKHADQMKSQFLSHMSHEFRTPLNSILALTRLLLDRVGGPLTEEQEKQVTFIRKSGENLNELVNDLLDLAKVEAGKTEVNPAEFLVSDLFAATRGVLKPLLANPAVNLIFDEAPEIPPLYSDEGKISQIVRNFVSNALKFTESGEVRVYAEASAGAREVCFHVSDTGIGIAPEHQDLIFEEFTQIDSALQRKVHGTGLGLPLSRKLAGLLGGSVSVRSAPGAGSTFTLRVPRIYAVSAAEAAKTPRARAAVRILSVDDEDVSRYLIRQTLAGLEAEFFEAPSAPEGLLRAREARPDVIVLDVLMPGMSGLDLLAVLKKDPALAAVPVIILTSQPLMDAERGAAEQQAFSILSKEILTRADASSVLEAEVRRAVQAG